MRRFLIPGLMMLAIALPAVAQDSGGLGLSPEALAAGGPRGLARPMRITFPSIGAADLQATPTAEERRQRHQSMIGRLRGDGGFLDGFSFGQPRAASRQPPPPPVEPVLVPVIIDQRTRIVNRYEDQRSRVVNRFEAPVTIGDNNVVLQQNGGSGRGSVAQQQVVTIGGAAPGSATNVVSGGSGGQQVAAGPGRGTGERASQPMGARLPHPTRAR